MTEPNAFTGAALDRAGGARRRDPRWLAEQQAHPAARAVLAGSAGVHLSGNRVGLVPLAALNGAEPLLLGLDEHGPVFAVDEDPPDAETLPPLIAAGGRRGEPPEATARERPDTGTRPVALRQAAALLPRAEGGLVAYAAALLNWHRRHRFCASCGAPTDVREGGLVRHCPRCDAEHHPRTDPVVIMLVTDGDRRILLGRQPSWPPRRYSALAGFVEPGESLEEAVEREVCEEARVSVGRPRYVASQPWPFPASLMLGFVVRWTGGEPDARHDELQDARWFSRAEAATAAEIDNDSWGGTGEGPPPDAPLLLPPRLAIARRLIEDWLSYPHP